MRAALVAAFSLCLCVLAVPVSSQEMTVDLDPAATKIDFTLAATMHTVHGTLKLKSGQIRFNPSTGAASGTIIVDAISADTSNSSRDKKMHAEILESSKFAEIVFTPTSEKGPIAQGGASTAVVSGIFRLHGQDHDAMITISVQPGAAGRIDASTNFPVPYVKWGLKNPSTFLLHVSDTVNVEVHASGKISRTP
jgi:polyisoprenoid-binding protein YceI